MSLIRKAPSCVWTPLDTLPDTLVVCFSFASATSSCLCFRKCRQSSPNRSLAAAITPKRKTGERVPHLYDLALQPLTRKRMPLQKLRKLMNLRKQQRCRCKDFVRCYGAAASAFLSLLSQMPACLQMHLFLSGTLHISLFFQKEDIYRVAKGGLNGGLH
jgi:hypothetical protein